MARIVQTEDNSSLHIPFVTHVCICGSNMWNVQVIFDDYEIAYYLTDMTCVNCGAHALAPTLVDKPEDV